MKRALVLSGGGAMGAYQVGMLHELTVARRLDFQIIRGVSVGSLNAAILAQAKIDEDSLNELIKRVVELLALWQHEIKGDHSVYRKVGWLRRIFGAQSLYTLDPLRKLIEERLDVEALRWSGRNFRLGTVSLVNGAYVEWEASWEPFIPLLLASCAIPVAFPPIKTCHWSWGDVLVDGGVRNITPLKSAFDAGADEIWVLLASRTVRENGRLPRSRVPRVPVEHWRKAKLWDIAKRAVEILADEVMLDDIRHAIKWNEHARRDFQSSSQVAHESWNTQAFGKRYVPIHILAPQQWYDPEGQCDDCMKFDPALIRRAIEHGREVAADPALWVWPVGGKETA